MRETERQAVTPDTPHASLRDASLMSGARGGVDFRAVREQISMSDVLRVLDWKPVEKHGDQLRGPCMIHGSSSETSRSLSVNISKNVFQCFAACCTAKGNQLDLYAAAVKLPIYEATVDLCDKLGLPTPRLERA